MAAEDYIDFEDDLADYWEALFKPIQKSRGRFFQNVDGVLVEDHHFIGYCEIIRCTEKSILCKFIDDEVQEEPIGVGIRKWSQRLSRWVPKSQIADQANSQESDSLSLNNLSPVGTKGNLWISGWLYTQWEKEGVQL